MSKADERTQDAETEPHERGRRRPTSRKRYESRIEWDLEDIHMDSEGGIIWLPIGGRAPDPASAEPVLSGLRHDPPGTWKAHETEYQAPIIDEGWEVEPMGYREPLIARSRPS